MKGQRPVHPQQRAGTAAGIRIRGRREAARARLAGLDVGLVERVDAEHGGRDRGGDLPSEAFLRHRQARPQLARQQRMARRGQFARQHRQAGIGAGPVRQVHEHAVTAIVAGRGQRLMRHRHQSLADLAGGFRQQLFQPAGQRFQARVGQ